MVTLLSLDSSTKSTGYAVFNNAVYTTSDVIDLSTEKDMNKRTELMISEILKLLEVVAPSIIVIERMHVQRNMSVVRALCEVIGAVRGWAITHNAFFYEIAPTEWRSAIGIQSKGLKREELKRLSLDYVADKYKITDISDDQSDAICIGDAYINIYDK